MVGLTNARGTGGRSGRYIELTVVGGTTRPESFENNTIWVNTADAITSWYVSINPPGNYTYYVTTADVNFRNAPSLDSGVIGNISNGSLVEVISISDGWAYAIYGNTYGYIDAVYVSTIGSTTAPEGTVWISVDYETDIRMELSNIPMIEIGIGTAYQFLSGVWVIKSAEIYTDGAYYASNLVLYSSGMYNSNYIWVERNPKLVRLSDNVRTNTDAIVVTNTSNYININISGLNGAWAAFACYYCSFVDLTDYDTIDFTFESTASNGNRTNFFSVSELASTKTNTYTNAAAISSWSARTAKTKQTISLDISSLTGNHCVNFGTDGAEDAANGCVVKIYSIELTKGASS